MSNSLDPDHARRFVGPDLGPNCLSRLSADDTGRQRVNAYAKRQRCRTDCIRAVESASLIVAGCLSWLPEK